jgi:hypothetical protein
MNSRRRISALQRFVGKPIAIRDALERVLPAAAGERKTHGEPLHMVGGWQTSIRPTGTEIDGMTIGRAEHPANNCAAARWITQADEEAEALLHALED